MEDVKLTWRGLQVAQWELRVEQEFGNLGLRQCCRRRDI